MKRKIYHQCGHYTNWNLESFAKDHCGDGLILSPVHYSKSQVDGLNSKIKDKSLFDPQFYLPRSTKKKLNSYKFFPENISGGFDTADFASLAQECAKACVKYQNEQGFQAVVIPTRYFDQMLPDLTERQDAFSVNPFLQAIKEQKIDKEIVISIVLTNHMVESEKYREKILNWLTSYEEIDTVYLIPDVAREKKQITSSNSLKAFAAFGEELINADLDVLYGYLNTESLLFFVLKDVSVTIGSFENTRIFSIDKFLSLVEERRGPKARIYLPGLLNWIQIGEAKEIRRRQPDLWKQIYVETPYAERALAAAVEPTFNQPDLYKHYFICITQQLAALNVLAESSERLELLDNWVVSAEGFYKSIKLSFDPHSKDDHLGAWKKTIKFLQGSA